MTLVMSEARRVRNREEESVRRWKQHRNGLRLRNMSWMILIERLLSFIVESIFTTIPLSLCQLPEHLVKYNAVAERQM